MNSSTTLQVVSQPETSAQWMERILSATCKLTRLRPFQLELALEIDKKNHVFCVVATGMGKTVVLMAGAMAASARSEKGIALLIVPTKVLVEQQAEVASRRGLRVLAINQDTVRDARLAGRDLFKELVEGDDVRMGVMTPKMLCEAEMTALLKKDAFVNLVRWVSIDEAQLARQAGVFQAGYKSLVYLHIRLPKSTVYTLASATAPPAEAVLIAKSLGLQPGTYKHARYSVDRPNLKYIPRFFQHPTTTGHFLDISFVVPIDMESAPDIIPTIMFAETILRGDQLMTYLDGLMPANIPGREHIIKTYTSLSTPKYRAQLKEDFESGKTRILIVTDTATYGFDIACVRQAIVFDLPKDLGKLEQQLGRAGRDGEPARAIGFAPEWVRQQPPDIEGSAKGKTDAARRAELPASLVRWYNPTPACCSRAVCMEHNGEVFVDRGPDCCVPIHDANGSAADLAMVARWAKHFEERQATVAVPHLRSDGTYRPLEKPMKESLYQMLDHWRHKTWASIRPSEDDPSERFLPECVLNAIVEKAHICTSLENLRVISEGFTFMDKYGSQLLKYLTEILDGFKQIIADREGGGSSSDESDNGYASYRMQLLQDFATVPVLKHYCRTLNLEVGGVKSALVDRLSTAFIA
ncbi:P-loop containing nucleoside triphosphate hydrolase protein [Favolaschia claudopus]|uniref:DNA 3'-5' helicase n=1 Tax=Favolaschia claudopus TaxID=2862362 RepID=A0AAW0EE67_9AGAR